MNLSKIINRFIYRDLVYIFSGSFILFYSGYIYNFDKCYLQYFKIINLIIKDNSTNFIFIFLLAGLSYISALFSQILFKSFFPSGIFANQKIYQDNLVNLLKKYNDEKDIILENLERFVFFKQIGTTLGSSLMISFLLFFIRIYRLAYIFILFNDQMFLRFILEIIVTLSFFIISIHLCIYLNIKNKEYEKDILESRDGFHPSDTGKSVSTASCKQL